MQYTSLGGTGLEISRIVLGCMSFGTPEWRNWVLGEAESEEIIEKAIDLGINCFDTANMYSLGKSEEILGSVLGEYDRDWTVVATKVYNSMDPENPNANGLSRKAIEQELANSLDRLDMDVVDLYQTHRWDYATPVEETLGALDDAVRRNQVRYVGASSMWAHQFADALHTSDRESLERFVSMQNHYNLAYREEEREMLPYCDQHDIGVIPWSPLGRGYLTRPHDEFVETTRGDYSVNIRDDHLPERIAHYAANGGEEINNRVNELADEKGVSMAQISIAWLLHKDCVDAPIVGTTSIDHLVDAVEALDIDLSGSDIDFLEEPYGPVSVDGHS